MKKFLIVSCVVFLTSVLSKADAQAPVIQSVSPNNTTISKGDKLELTINLTAAYLNAYDYDDIAVTCTITKPGGSQEVLDGFFMENFTLGSNGFVSPTGTSSFKVRYSPVVPGNYSYVVSCTNLLGSTQFAAQNFQCVGSPSSGFVRKNTTNYLSFDDGSQYIPIGENMGWQNTSVVSNYTTWLNKLASNGGNFIRVWMSSWAFALEWKNGTNGFEGLKKYKQSNAWYLDWLLDYCKQKNVYMMLALNNHGQVSTNVNPEWSNNPYNAANGGPAVNTWDFFTNTTARNLHKNRLRYIVARYGYSQHIQSWELFNELHWTNQFETHKDELTAWDSEMATYIKSKDVNNHLVTTSYGGTEVSTSTWALPSIDFTQTHFYVNSPNIESVLAAANQAFFSQYNKPTLNGEFGLGPAGSTLSADDPNGVHVHNAMWGSMLSGALGTGMTWWWDDYIEPRNLYYHFKGLKEVISLIDLKNDNYKKAPATITGGGAADLSITPGGGFAKPAAAVFTIDASGNMSPGAASLSQYMFGSTYNTQNRNPPTFNINFPVAGQFKVVVSGVSATAPKVTIYLDGNQVLNQDAITGTTYTINVAAGQHAIKVDNLGIDWFSVSNYVFTNVGAPLAAYNLKAEANNKAAGYLLNNKYNWQYLKGSGNVPPAAVTGSTLSLPGLANGNYTVFFYSTATGEQLSTALTTVSGGTLQINVPSVEWDLAYRIVENSTLPIKLASFKGEKVGTNNRLFIEIATAENVQNIWLQRAGTLPDFSNLTKFGLEGSILTGRHSYTDEQPLAGTNYYRLKILDKDGSQSFSGVVRLVNDLVQFSVMPNPFADKLLITLQEGNYLLKLTDQLGKTIAARTVKSSARQNIQWATTRLKAGTYYVVVYDDNGAVVGCRKLVK